MRFVNSWVLICLSLLPLLALAGYWLLARAVRRLALFVSPALQERLAPPRRQATVAAQSILALAGLALLLLAAARPQWGRRQERVATRARNVVIALDVSRSMLAADVHPNRLERAKVDIMDLLGELRGDRAGLLAFRGKANLLCPLTTDRAFLRQALDGISCDSAPRGQTDLADAIGKSLDALSAAFDENNAIMLISDGEDLAGQAVAAAAEAARRGVPIFTVGIGDPAGASIPAAEGQGNLVFQGKEVKTRLTESTLAEIARVTGGAYIPLATAGTASTTLGAIYRQHLRQVAVREQEEELERRYIERYTLFLLPAILLLLAAAMLSRGRLAAARRQRQASPPPLPARGGSMVGTALTLIVALLAAPAAPAAVSSNAPPAAATPSSATNRPAVPPGREGARLAQRLYRRQAYSEAAAAYLEAARGVETAEADRYRHNAAVAHFKGGNLAAAAELARSLGRLPGHDAAAEIWGAAQFALADPAVASNAVARAQALDQAGAGFQQALRAVPAEARRRRNLARALAPLPAAREAAHIEEVLARHAQTPPDQLAATMLREQRVIRDAIPGAFTNDAAVMISQLEGLSSRQERNADLWIPLKKALLESPALTNAQQRAMIGEHIEQTRDTMGRAAARLADLDGEGMADAARAGQAAYTFWRLLAMPPALVDEDIAAQTNAFARPDRPRDPPRPDQPEAAELTKLFRERFPAWADQVQAQAQSDTNAPSLTPEARAEIEQLAEETEALQQRAAASAAAAERQPLQEQALENLHRIRELMPKQSSQQQQPEEQQQDNEQQQPDEQQQPEEQEQQQKEQPEQQEDKRPEPPPDVQEVLRRALQREKEHEAEKRRQMREYPMPPDVPDW